VDPKLDLTRNGFETLRLPFDGTQIDLARTGRGRPLLLQR
jgi:hypothetical protein